jgi:hypothetical protein
MVAAGLERKRFEGPKDVLEWANVDVTLAVIMAAPTFVSRAVGAGSLLRADASMPEKFYGIVGKGEPDLLLATLPDGSSNVQRANSALARLDRVCIERAGSIH